MRCFQFWVDCRLVHNDTVWVGEFTRKGLLRKVEAILKPFATGLPVPGHLGKCSWSPDAGLGFFWLVTSD